MEKDAIVDRIKSLKKEKNAVILVHNYQRPEIYEIADFIGDSLELSRKAAETKADIIVFCGVRFMAETAKILSPEKTVLLPDKDAGCQMANMVTADDVRRLKSENPKIPVVSYVNTTAEVKAESDICCTSANAVKIVESLNSESVIFVPDINLGSYVQQMTGKNIILAHGFCYAHMHIFPDMITGLKKHHPEAVVIAHPECRKDVRDMADEILSTGGMIKFAKESPANEFIIATESGMVERLKREIPYKTFYPVESSVCINMKKITLEKVLGSLENEQYRIEIEENVQKKAYAALMKMLNL
ncbi:MAG: quinolinate synthase NadA [Candidatus Micrarchaeota archaeon]|nr:quinolinate synthase NadA [Candidatus Micrarchaeota archaeon]